MKETLPSSVSIVVVTWNSQSTIGMCLDSILEQKEINLDLEVIVVDNASSDATLEQIRQRRGLRLITLVSNQGFCKGNNVGIQASRGKYILLLNPDAKLVPGFLKTGVAILDADPQIALLSGKIFRMLPDGQPVLQNGLPVFDTVGVAIKRNRQTIELSHDEPDRGQYDREREVFGISGAVCLCRAQALAELQVDGQVFDETFFAYKEDVDLSWRARLLGWKCVYTPRIFAYHVGGWRSKERTRHQISRSIRHHSFKNRRLMMLRNEMPPHFLHDLLFIFGFELIALGYVLVREPFLLRAYSDIIKSLPRTLHWRRTIQARCQVNWQDLEHWFR